MLVRFFIFYNLNTFYRMNLKITLDHYFLNISYTIEFQAKYIIYSPGLNSLVKVLLYGSIYIIHFED
jgi:hypothetical protein